MSEPLKDIKKNSEKRESERNELKSVLTDTKPESEPEPEIIEKDFVPHFFPTFRISRKFYAVPIILVVIFAGILSYITYVIAGVQIEGGYVSEKDYGITAGLINGLIFVSIAAISSFIIIFLVKKRGIDVLRYIFGVSFGLLGFTLTWFFGDIFLFLLFYNLPSTDFIFGLYVFFSYFVLIGTIAFTIIMIYKYFSTKSIATKNTIVLYISLLTGAMLGIIMPLWTTLTALILFSLWDIYAVKAKRGPIKEMIDIASKGEQIKNLSEDEIKQKIDSGEIIYDTSKLEIGIGDLTFYSMLTSCALIITGNLLVMFFTAIAIIIGTGITIQGLKKNKILPGLPISIFLGIATMLLSWYILVIFNI